MGNSASGSISITVHPQQHSNPAHAGYYVAGGKINGVVYVSSNAKGGMSAKSSSLIVYMTGKEDVKVQYTDTVGHGDHTETVTSYAYASREIVRIKIPIISNAKIFYGRREYPFEVSSTFAAHYERNSQFEVRSESCETLLNTFLFRFIFIMKRLFYPTTSHLQ